MKKLFLIILISSLSVITAAGTSYTLTFNENLYNPGDFVAMIPMRQYQFKLDVFFTEPLTVYSPVYLMLQPNLAAHFADSWIPSLPPYWDIYYWDDYEILIIDNLNPTPVPPLTSHMEYVFYVDFIGFASDLSVLDEMSFKPTDTWHLVVPEPAAILLLGLGGLALRTRKQ